MQEQASEQFKSVYEVLTPEERFQLREQFVFDAKAFDKRFSSIISELQKIEKRAAAVYKVSRADGSHVGCINPALDMVRDNLALISAHCDHIQAQIAERLATYRLVK